MKLDWKFAAPCALALALLGPPAAAQDDTPPDSGGSSAPRSGKRVPRSKVPVSIPVEGIPADDVTALLEQVRQLEQDVFTCGTCKAQSRVDGACARCEGEELEKTGTTTVFAKAELGVDRRFLTVTLAPHHWGSLAELAAILEPSEARIKRGEFRLPTHARFSVRGVEGEKGAKRLRSALVDLKVFPSATVVAIPDSDAVWVYPKHESPGVKVAELEEVIGKMRGELVVEDVQWAAFCPVCGTRPASEVGAPVQHSD